MNQITAMQNEMNRATLALLQHWMESAPDRENGGFYNVNCWNEVMVGGEKSATLNFRIFWTFVQAYLFYGDKDYLGIADRAYEYIIDHFLDRECGGAYPILSPDGKPISTDKQGYVHSFAIAAFAAYYRATNRAESLQCAQELFHLVEEKGKNEYGGYHDVCDRQWRPTAKHTQPEANNAEERDKSLRPNMHLLWGFEQLRLAWQSPVLDRAIEKLTLLLSERLTDKETGEVGQAFSGDWNRVSDRDEYGDDFELSWILWDALPVLQSKDAAQVRSVCERIARHATLSGVDREFGGIYQHYHRGQINTEKEWWVQAEAINGLLSAYRHTGEPSYLREAKSCWSFVRDNMVQPDGTWQWKTRRDGRCYRAWEIRGPLMCPYHSGRMLMRSIEQLREAR